MTETPGFLLTILAFAGVIGPLIFIHEMGHYLVGRLFGVKAEAFSIGFGRELVGWTDRRGTRWKVALLPLGGYVKFAGDMNPASTPTDEWLAMPAEERAHTFQAKPVWQRFLIVLAGPAINFLFAILVFAGFFLWMGDWRTPSTIAAVAPQSAAARAGIRPGDRITMIAGQSIDWFEDITPVVAIRPGEALSLDVYRGKQQIHLIVTPDVDVQRESLRQRDPARAAGRRLGSAREREAARRRSARRRRAPHVRRGADDGLHAGAGRHRASLGEGTRRAAEDRAIFGAAGHDGVAAVHRIHGDDLD